LRNHNSFSHRSWIECKINPTNWWCSIQLQGATWLRAASHYTPDRGQSFESTSSYSCVFW
jgi:hypothetical protein